MKRSIALVDCDSFFVSCEQVVNPELVGKPVCVIGSTDGCVLSRSKEAKATGIKVGMPYFMAKKDYSKLIYVCAHMGLYAEISKKVMQCLKQFSPDMEQYSIDEAFLDITGCEKLYKKNYVEIVRMIKDKVKEETGIPVSIGLSSSKTLAKLASDMAKSIGGIMEIKEDDIQEVLKNTPIEDVWGVGRNNTRTLKQQGILTAFDFTLKSEQWIKELLGIVGVKLKKELWGECVSKVDSKEKIPESIQHTAAFKKCTSDLLIIKRNLKRHIHSASLKLRRYEGSTAMIGVMLRTKDFKVLFTKKKLANPTNFEIEIAKTANELLLEIYDENTLYRAVGVVLEKFTYGENRQTSLFDDQKLEKNLTLAKTLDRIEEKFGKDSIKIGFD